MRIEHTIGGVAGRARLVDYLKDRLVQVPVTEIGNLITEGHVGLGTQRPGRTFDRVADGDRLTIDGNALHALQSAGRWNPPWQHPVDVVHEDDDVLVVVKPAGLHVHPLGDRRSHTLVNALVHRASAAHEPPWGAWRPHVVSRLDCVVSGLLVVAKNAATKARLVDQQKKHRLGRTYHAMVTGILEDDEGIVDRPIGREPGRGWRRSVLPVADGGLVAVTHWRVLARLGDRTLVELEPRTGRTHQLRVHLASLGHPIVGDDLYASSAGDVAPERRLGERAVRPIALHAVQVRFTHPHSGTPMELRYPAAVGFGLDDGKDSP